MLYYYPVVLYRFGAVVSRLARCGTLHGGILGRRSSCPWRRAVNYRGTTGQVGEIVYILLGFEFRPWEVSR